MVSRVFVEKKPGFDIEAQQLCTELRDMVPEAAQVRAVRVFNRYDVEGIDAPTFERCVPMVFSEPQSDVAFAQLPENVGASSDAAGTQICFAVEFLPGQFDQRADSASECIQLVTQGERPTVRSAKLYAIEFERTLSADETARAKEAIKRYLINPVEAREASFALPESLALVHAQPAPVEHIADFLEFDDAALAAFISARGLAMDLADLQLCQRYFASEGRCPTITEIKMIDTYWSDHCRHTTFGTELTDIRFDDDRVKQAFERYQELRHELGRDKKPVCLMDMGTIGAKYLASKGILRGLDESEEVNACTVKCTVDVDGKPQEWLYLFKNETHNHPTEIEPFGGAATCVGGAIRDPLSGRAYVYQAMRVTGAANPLAPLSETLPGKLPQRKLVVQAAQGYSSYGNQIGLATGQVHELYHPGYAAKRLEIGAVVGATPAENVRREEPAPGDVVVLLGGRTGRDGIGGATGSSKAHSTDSLTHCGAEVQKGNPPVERKIQRLFRRGEACRLIKRCNDFGAGGVSVAIGELASGLAIDLDLVPKKYDGLDGTELAISESQERMAVALAPEDVDAFLALAHEENLEATPVARVTEEPRVRMTWNGETIVDVSREFLASNGAPKHQAAQVCAPVPYRKNWEGEGLRERMAALLSDLNVCSNKGLVERFDSTIGAATVLMPFGGTRQLTPSMAMVAKLPVAGETTTCSGLAWGFNPYLSSVDQFEGAYVAVLESIAKLVAAGFERTNMYLTFQEYFEKLRDDPARWGKPVSALLGALSAQLDFGVGAIGGKDSMSGSFENLDVPPTLVSFATAIGSTKRVVSPEFKQTNSRVMWVRPCYEAGQLVPSVKSACAAMDFVEALVAANLAVSISTPGYGCAAEALFKMCVGNGIGLALSGIVETDLFTPAYGSFLVELPQGANIPEDCACAATEAGVDILGIGTTTESYTFVLDDESVPLGDLQEVWECGIEAVFPYRSHGAAATNSQVTATNAQDAPRKAVQTSETDAPAKEASGEPSTDLTPLCFECAKPHCYGGLAVARPRVLIPVFPGTNCEYDSARAFERAGAQAETFVINTLSPAAISQSVRECAQLIRESQIVMLPGGFSGGDEPDGSAKFIAAFFRAPEITDAVRDLLQHRDGLMLGICNGFQALVKLGLVPYGDIVPASDESPTLTFNTIGRHQSRLVRTRVASSLSPWLSACSVGDIHTVAISHGEGRFVASPELLERMYAAGQVATQYVDAAGVPSMDLDVNPNGSVCAIEGITSADGRIFGKMGHSERSGDALYKNVPGSLYQPIFEGGVNYFRL